MSTAMVKKHQVGLFVQIEATGDYMRIKKSTELTLSMNPETEDYDYIADESPTTELLRYKPTIDQDLTMYKGETDYDAIFPFFYALKVGADAHVRCMVVFMAEGETGGGYKAWDTDAILSVQDMNAVDSKLNFQIMFGGTVLKGTATMADGKPTFVAAV